VEGTKKQYDDLDRLPLHRVPRSTARPFDCPTVEEARDNVCGCFHSLTNRPRRISTRLVNPVRLHLVLCHSKSTRMASTREEVTPWFCVKSTLLGDASPGPAPELQKKVFLNICTRPSVSKPPELTDDVLHYHLKSPSESDPYLIPIVLAEPREDVDKGASKPNEIYLVLSTNH